MKIIEEALQLMRTEAERKGENAAYGGRSDDGGMRGMLSTIETFEDGIRYSTTGVHPEWLKEYVDQAKTQKDPEYNEYIRLKEKFE